MSKVKVHKKAALCWVHLADVDELLSIGIELLMKEPGSDTPITQLQIFCFPLKSAPTGIRRMPSMSL